MEKKMKRKYEKPTADKLSFDYMENVVASFPGNSDDSEDSGHGDVGRGRGGGGGCDGVPGHSNQKTFNNGRNSPC